MADKAKTDANFYIICDVDTPCSTTPPSLEEQLALGHSFYVKC